MTEKRTECSNCHYLIGYPGGKKECLMKQEFCIIDGKTSYPRDCKYFKERCGMTAKRFTYDKPLVAFSKGGITDNVTGETYEFTMDTVLDLLNALHEENKELKKENAQFDILIKNNQLAYIDLEKENEQLREHFIYLIGTALEDKECRKIYAKGLLEIFDDCANLDEAKIKIKEYLE